MAKIFDRMPETERLIAIMEKNTERRLLTKEELTTVADSKRRNIWPYVTSARRYMMKNHGVRYGTIRGIGIQPMTAGEIALYGPKRFKRADRQYKSVLEENELIAGDNSLSVDERATRDTTNVMAAKLRQELATVKNTIKIAVQNGVEALANILNAVHGAK